MQIKLIEEMFGADTYELEVTGNSLVLLGVQSDEIRIPFTQLRHFDLEGSGKKLKHFILETTGETYEGRFIQRGDAEKLIALLREKCGCYMDVRIDME